jgi:lipid biosynthesis B12-binding/radical SAM protein
LSRVLLVSANVTREPYPVYPLGMALLASALSSAGHEVGQFDFLASDEDEAALRGRIAGFAPDFVCLSIRNLDNCDSLNPVGYPAVAGRLAAAARSACAAPLIVGGPAFSIMPELLLELTGADHGVVGEGERALCRLIDDLAAGRGGPRIVKDDRLLAGADMPSPSFSRELVDHYVACSGMVNLQTKRGCPHGCVYCSYPALEGTGWRCRDPREVADDIERLRADHGVGRVFFTDSVFNDEAGHFLQVAEEIVRRALDVRFSCYMRPQGIRRPDLALLKRAGLYAAELGTDAACDAALRGLGKGFTFGDALEANRAFVAERIPCAHFVMFGGPGETPETVAEGLSNLDRLENTVVFAYAGISILPGTALFERAVREGVIEGAGSLRRPAYYVSPGIDPAALAAMIARSFQGRRDRIFPPSEGQRKLEVLHRFGYRGLLWDTLIRFPKEEA